MGTLKIKINNTGDISQDWQNINNLDLTTLEVANTITSNGDANIEGNLSVGTSITLDGKDLGKVIEDSAVTVYIHVNSNGTNSYSSTDSSVTESSLMNWFNNAYPANSESRKKAVKGFLIEHRTIDNNTYHLPYYWNGSKDEQGNDTSAWVLLNAIWG